MKKLHRIAALSAVFLVAAGTPLGAQILTTTNLAYAATPLFASSPRLRNLRDGVRPGRRHFFISKVMALSLLPSHRDCGGDP